MSKREENELKLKRSKLEMRKKGKREGRKRRRWVYKEEWEGPPPARTIKGNKDKKTSFSTQIK